MENKFVGLTKKNLPANGWPANDRPAELAVQQPDRRNDDAIIEYALTPRGVRDAVEEIRAIYDEIEAWARTGAQLGGPGLEGDEDEGPKSFWDRFIYFKTYQGCTDPNCPECANAGIKLVTPHFCDAEIKVYEEIGRYGANVALTGELAPHQELTDAVTSLANLRFTTPAGSENNPQVGSSAGKECGVIL